MSQCEEQDYLDAITEIRDADLVFTRPTLIAMNDPPEDLVSRHMGLLRALQSRASVRLTHQAGGFTNISKCAHMSFLSMLGLRVP